MYSVRREKRNSDDQALLSEETVASGDTRKECEDFIKGEQADYEISGFERETASEEGVIAYWFV